MNTTQKKKDCSVCGDLAYYKAYPVLNPNNFGFLCSDHAKSAREIFRVFDLTDFMAFREIYYPIEKAIGEPNPSFPWKAKCDSVCSDCKTQEEAIELCNKWNMENGI